MDQPNNIAHMKVACLQLIATAGWDYFRKFAETTIRELSAKAIAEDDREKRETFIADARGAKKFWEGIQERLYTASTQSTETPLDPADEFYAILEKPPHDPA